MEILCEVSSEQWAAVSSIATAISALVLIVSMAIALRSLRTIGRTHELQAVNQFYELVRDSEVDRYFIFQEIDLLDPATELTTEQERRVRHVVNFLNKVGMLMDMKLLPQKFVLGLTHALIIRTCFLVIPYAAAKEATLGGRYGRRLTSLRHQAQMYHDASPNHRKTSIKIHKKGLHDGEVIYQTRPLLGSAGVCQRSMWRLQRWLHWYYAPGDLVPETMTQRAKDLLASMVRRIAPPIRCND